MDDAKRTTNFVFTDYERDHTFWEVFFKKNKVKWLKYGEEECPKTGKVHFQGLIVFENARTFGSFRKLVSPRHIEIMEWSIDTNDRYVSKDGNVREYGTKPTQGKRTDLDAVYTLLDSGVSVADISRSHRRLWTMYRRAFEEYVMIHEPKRTWMTEVLVFQGKPGTGKTTKASEMGAVFLKISGDIKEPFVGGYRGEDIVCFDDFNPDSCTLTWILNICNKTAIEVNVKGGWRNWKPRTIIFTTNGNARKWWGGSPQWLRRITSVEEFKQISE